jgi:hypothetical protein
VLCEAGRDGRPSPRVGRGGGAVFVGLLKEGLSDCLDVGFEAGTGGGPIDGRPATLNRDFALEFEVRAVVGGVVVRGDDCPELLSWDEAIFVGDLVGDYPLSVALLSEVVPLSTYSKG